MTSKLFLYISMSLDGFIATDDDSLEWLSIVQTGSEEDYGYSEITKRTTSYIVGRKTYDVVKQMLDGDFPQSRQFDCYVISRNERADEKGVTFYNGDIEQLVKGLKRENKGDIYCDGGGEIVKMLLEKNLIDEYIISVIPIILGGGKRLFKGGVDPINLKAKSTKLYDSGLIQLRYDKAIES